MIFTKHDVALVVVDLGQTKEDDCGQEKRGLTEILLGDETLPTVGGDQTSWTRVVHSRSQIQMKDQ